MSMTTTTHIREAIRILEDDVRELERKIDKLDTDSLEAVSLEAESASRILNVKLVLLSEQKEKLERIESNSAREAAEARLAYHVENDTLDLY